MKAIILARVSTEEQKEAGNSLPAQVFRLKSYIEKNSNLELEKEFTFDESAFKENRAKFDDVIDYIKEQKEIIAFCCDKVDRLARDFLVGLPKVEQLRREGKIELHFPSDNLVLNQNSPATDLFHFNIAVSLAQYYSNAISDNTKRALEQKLRSGEWIGQARVGYLNVTQEDGKKDLVLDPQRAHLVQKLFELYATGNYSVKTVREETYKLGLRSRNDKRIPPSMVHKTLKDKFYIGTMTSKGREYPHKYPRIISMDLFNKVQGVLSGRQKKATKYAVKPFALRGLIKCKQCGCSISPELKKGKYILYSCTNYKGIHKKKVYVNETELLKPIHKVLEGMKMSQARVNRIVSDLKALNESKNEFHKKSIQELQNDYNFAQNKLEKLLDLRLDDSITSEIYDKKMKELKEEQYVTTRKIEEYTQADENYHIIANTVFSLANRAQEIFESSEPNEKRQLLNLLIQNCRLSGKKLVFEVRSPFNTILETAHQPLGLPGSDSNRRPID